MGTLIQLASYMFPTRISAGVDCHPCFFTFIYMIPTDCKITTFTYGTVQVQRHTHA